MQKLYLGSLVKGPEVSNKTFNSNHQKYLQICKFEESKEWTEEERECKLLEHEYKLCKEANPEMSSTFLGSKIVTEKGQKLVKHPTKKEYLDLLVEKAKTVGVYGYLGLYFSGSSFYHTGDWAVLADNGEDLDSISIQDIY